MHFPLRLPCVALVSLIACTNPPPATSATDTDTSTGSTTTDPTLTSTSPTGPTTGTTEAPPTSTGPTTSTTTGTSTTGGPEPVCSVHTNEADCNTTGGCEWAQVVGYSHGTQGCQGEIRDFCVPTNTSGGPTSVWKGEGGDLEVLQFGFDPSDLGPEWQECGCDGPLACLCTGTELDCPELLDAFCGTITSENGCTNTLAAGELVCGWFTVSTEGPLDGLCDDPPWGQVCLPAVKIGTDTCDPISLPYVDQGYCMGWTDPVFWRDHDGIIEVTTNCGPEPFGWTLCVADDPNQPDECKCGCKIPEP